MNTHITTKQETSRFDFLKNKTNIIRGITIVFAIVLITLSTILLIDKIAYNQALMNFTNEINILSEVGTMEITGTLAAIGAGIAAVGMIGAGIGQGYATGKAVEAIGRNPEAEAQIRSTMLIGIALTESGALYALVIGVLALFVS